MEAIMLSLHSKWIKPIMDREKIYEVRKRAPVCKYPIKVYIYCTQNGDEKFLSETKKTSGDYKLNGTVCGEFVCNDVMHVYEPFGGKEFGTYLKSKDLCNYASGSDHLDYLQIESPVMYDKPLQLSDFGLERPPMSWMYCEEMKQ